MGSFTNYLEGKVMNHVFGTGSGVSAAKDYTRPRRKFVALSTVTITDTATGATLHEPDGGAYVRRLMYTWDDAASDGVTANSAEIAFPAATSNWGTITDFAIVDSDANGNVLAYGALTVAKSVQTGDTPKFAIQDIDVTLN